MKYSKLGLNNYLGITITLDETFVKKKKKKGKSWQMKSTNY